MSLTKFFSFSIFTSIFNKCPSSDPSHLPLWKRNLNLLTELVHLVKRFNSGSGRKEEYVRADGTILTYFSTDLGMCII